MRHPVFSLLISFLLIVSTLAQSSHSSNPNGISGDESNCYGDVCCPGQAISTNQDTDEENMICCVGNKNGGIDLTETTCTSGVAVPMTADDYDSRVAVITESIKSAASASKSASKAGIPLSVSSSSSSAGVGPMITAGPWAGVVVAAGGLFVAI